MSAKRKLLISVLLMLFVGIAVVVTVSTVFSLTQQNVTTSLNMSYTVENIEGMVSASYKIGSTTGDLIAEADADHKSSDGKSLIFKQEDVDHAGNLNFPDGTLTLTSENSEIIIEYKYTNTGPRHYIATMSFDSELIRNNMVVEYSIDGVNYDIYRYAVVVPEGAVNKSYWIKIRVDDLLENASFVGDLDWELKGCDPEDEDYLFWESINLTGDETTGEYSASFSGVAPANGLINFPREVNGYPVTSISENDDISYGEKQTVTSVFIPDSVKKIDSHAFLAYGKLNQVVFEQNQILTVASVDNEYGLKTIGDGAFNGCYELTKIEIPNTVTKIGMRAFQDCRINNVVIPDNVIEIGIQAFKNCGEESVYIGKSVQLIEDDAFDTNPEDLSNITIHPENVNVKIENYCLINIDKYNNINLVKGCNRSVIPEEVESILSAAFQRCNGLVNIEIPDNVGYVWGDIFWHCENLTTLKLGKGVSIIASGLLFQGFFPYCDKLTNIEIDADNTYFRVEDGCVIENAANRLVFCKKVSEIVVPNSVIEIGSDAFMGNRVLTKLTIPSSVTKIWRGAFFMCDNLAQVVFEIKTGWNVGTREILEEELASPEDAAIYLIENSYYNDWILS